MSDILIIGFTNLFQMPYLRNFSTILEEEKSSYDVIYWNRFGIEEESKLRSSQVIVFSHSLKDDANMLLKLRGFLLYRNKVLNVLKTGRYRKIIVLTTLPAFLIYGILVNNHRCKFILDIRDYSYENSKLFKHMLSKIIDNAYFVTISSIGFKNFLPESDKYLVSNNFNLAITYDRKFFENKLLTFNSHKITIIYIGSISYLDMNLKFLKLFGNHSDFYIKYVGYGPANEKIQEFCRLMKYDNVQFHGRFSPAEKSDHYKTADLIFNLYGNESSLTKYAISNKLYDAMVHYIPILVCENTYMEKEAISNGFGYTVNLEDKSTPKNLYNWYIKLDKMNLIKNCDAYLKKTLLENKAFEDRVRGFLKA